MTSSTPFTAESLKYGSECLRRLRELARRLLSGPPDRKRSHRSKLARRQPAAEPELPHRPAPTVFGHRGTASLCSMPKLVMGRYDYRPTRVISGFFPESS